MNSVFQCAGILTILLAPFISLIGDFVPAEAAPVEIPAESPQSFGQLPDGGAEKHHPQPLLEQDGRKELSIAYTPRTILVGARSDLQQQLLDYAWKYSGRDLDFILTVERESEFNPLAVGDDGLSHGLCQWHRTWHSSVIDSEPFSDPYWQVRACHEYYSAARAAGKIHRRLSGWNRRHEVRERFYFPNHGQP